MKVKDLAIAIAEILSSESVDPPNISITGDQCGLDVEIKIHAPRFHFNPHKRCMLTENKYAADEKLEDALKIICQAIDERNAQLQRQIDIMQKHLH